MAKFILALLIVAAAGATVLAAAFVLARALVLVLPLAIVGLIIWACGKFKSTKTSSW